MIPRLNCYPLDTLECPLDSLFARLCMLDSDRINGKSSTGYKDRRSRSRRLNDDYWFRFLCCNLRNFRGIVAEFVQYVEVLSGMDRDRFKCFFFVIMFKQLEEL